MNINDNIDIMDIIYIIDIMDIMDIMYIVIMDKYYYINGFYCKTQR